MIWFFTPLDLAAFVWFLCCWIGFTVAVNTPRRRTTSINQSMFVHRQEWMRQMVGRDNRVVDGMLTGHIMNSASFLASTTLVVVAALLGMLGAMDKVHAVASDIPFTAVGSRQAWEAKVIMMLVIFVYAFFKFTWSIRMWNYCCVLIGGVRAVPVPEPEAGTIAYRLGFIAHQGATSFNSGLRAYYFGLAALAWFLHPVAFLVATSWVVGVLYWRQAHSPTARALRVAPAAYEAARAAARPPRPSGED